MPVRTLFVDDEPTLLRSIANELVDFSDAMEPLFAGSAADALELLDRGGFDAVVSDMRMPEMDGVEFLIEVERRYPSVARIVLSGNPEYEGTLRRLPMAHRFIVKPMDVDDVVELVQRTVAITRRLENEAIIRVANTVGTLPPAPRVSAKLEALFADPGATMGQAAKVIATDPGLVSRTIHLVNSASFNLRRNIATVDEAVLYLGRERIRQVVLAAEAFGSLPTPPPDLLDIDQFQRCSLVVGELARRLAAPEKSEVAFLGGLLHGIGRLVLASRMEDGYRKSLRVRQQKKIPRHLAERTTCGATAADLGAVVLNTWCFSFPVLECVAEHDECLQGIADRPMSCVQAVQVASRIVHFLEEDNEAGLDSLCAKGVDRMAKRTLKCATKSALKLLAA